MSQRLVHIALLVNDYDEAIEFYTEKLSFTLLEDTRLSDEKRWVLVKPAGSECALLLARAASDEQRQCVGKQSAGRVFLFLETDNFDCDYEKLRENNVTIVREPQQEPYGKVCVFEDLYGNRWDLIEYKKSR